MGSAVPRPASTGRAVAEIAVQGVLFDEPVPAGSPATWTLKSIAEYYGTDYPPAWLSPVCSNRPMHHTGCDYTLCTCKCHVASPQLAETAVAR